ncbi:hypothetical protein FKM82_025026 [Ascaphus truei]
MLLSVSRSLRACISLEDMLLFDLLKVCVCSSSISLVIRLVKTSMLEHVSMAGINFDLFLRFVKGPSPGGFSLSLSRSPRRRIFIRSI